MPRSSDPTDGATTASSTSAATTTSDPDPDPYSSPSGPGLRKRRPSASELLLSAAHALEDKLLLLWDELPAWRRDNHFILSGYRRESGSYLASFLSIFAIHNESVNIWTHLVGAVGFLVLGVWAAVHFWHVVVPADSESNYYSRQPEFLAGFLEFYEENARRIAERYATASSSDFLVLWCFFAGAVACLGMSATFHALTNHSEPVSKWGNKLDYSGIVFLIVGSYVPALYYGLFCHPRFMTVYLYLICLLGLGCMAVSWLEHFRTPQWRAGRALMFVGLGTSGVVPVIHGLSLYGYAGLDERMGLSWVLFEGVLYIVGAGIYAARWPERMLPGKFDIWGSSHQIFHFFVVAAAISHLYGMVKAFEHHHSVMGAQC